MTAVEYLANELDSIVELYPSQYEKVNKAIEQAKEMEKKQIEDAYTYGQKNIIDILSEELKFSFAKTNKELEKVIENKENNENAEQYYKQKYKTI